MVTHKVTIEDLYRQDEACLEKSHDEKYILDYNKDIDIVVDVKTEILLKAETYRPVTHYWKKPPESNESLIAWEICDGATDDGIEWSIYLLSNGRLLYSYFDNDGSDEDEYIDLKHITDFESLEFNIWRYGLLDKIVDMAVTEFKIKPKINWYYNDGKEFDESVATTNILLSQILEELRRDK